MQLTNVFVTALALAAVGVDAGSVVIRAAELKVPVTLQVYRHANSCSNVATQCIINVSEPSCLSWDSNIHDSAITDWGVSASVNESKVIPQPDVVMTSSLLRAIETGLYQFPTKTVYVVPYIKEMGSDPPSTPLPEKQQREAIVALDGANSAKRVSYKYDTAPAHECTKSDATPKCSVDWGEFMSFLGETLASNPPKEIATQLKSGQPVSIAVVSHLFTIALGVLPEPKFDINNNQGFQSNFTFDPATKKVTPDTGATWTEITLGVKGPCSAGRKISPADTERCAKRNPTNWAQLQKTCT